MIEMITETEAEVVHYGQLREPDKYEVLMQEARERGWTNSVDVDCVRPPSNYASSEIRAVRSTPHETDCSGRNFADEVNEGVKIDSASAVNAMHRRSINNTRVIVGIGGFLTRKKKEIGHGGWLDWLSKNLTFSHDWVTRYTRCYEHRKAILEKSLTMTVKACLELCVTEEGKQQKQKKQKTITLAVMNRQLSNLLTKWREGGAESSDMREALQKQLNDWQW